MSSLHEGDEESAELEEEQERKLQEMEEDLEKQKEAQLKSGASEEEVQAALAALQRQHEAKRKVLIGIFWLRSNTYNCYDNNSKRRRNRRKKIIRTNKSNTKTQTAVIHIFVKALIYKLDVS